MWLDVDVTGGTLWVLTRASHPVARTNRLRMGFAPGGAMVRRRRLFANLGYPVIPRLACMLARGVDGTDFRPSRSGDGTEPVASHSLPGCRGAMLRRRRLYAYLRYPVAPMHVRVGWMGPIFDRRETVMGPATLISKP